MENNSIANRGSYINAVSKELLSHEKATLKLEQSHESNLKDKEYKHITDFETIKQNHEKTLKEKELGFVGKCFGGRELVSLNISGLLIILLLLSGVILSMYVYYNSNNLEDVLKIWGIITPLITLTLGYIFGSNDK